jgi:hypothetical protein
MNSAHEQLSRIERTDFTDGSAQRFSRIVVETENVNRYEHQSSSALRECKHTGAERIMHTLRKFLAALISAKPNRLGRGKINFGGPGPQLNRSGYFAAIDDPKRKGREQAGACLCQARGPTAGRRLWRQHSAKGRLHRVSIDLTTGQLQEFHARTAGRCGIQNQVESRALRVDRSGWAIERTRVAIPSPPGVRRARRLRSSSRNRTWHRVG